MSKFYNDVIVNNNLYVEENIFLDNKNKISNSGDSLTYLSMDSSEPIGSVREISQKIYSSAEILDGIRYENLSPTTETGVGTGLILDAIYDINNTQIGIINIVNGGQGYENGDSVKILGNTIGGNSPADDFSLTIISVKKPNDIILSGSNIIISSNGYEEESVFDPVTATTNTIINLSSGWAQPNFLVNSLINDDDVKRNTIQSLNPLGWSIRSIKGRNAIGSSFLGEFRSNITVNSSSLSLQSYEEVYNEITENVDNTNQGGINISSGLVTLTSEENDLIESITNRSEFTLLYGNSSLITESFGIRTSSGGEGSGLSADFLIRNNSEQSVSTNQNRATIPTIISSKNSTVLSGVTNSVIIGGENLTASENNTLYTQNLMVNNELFSPSLTANTINVSEILSLSPGYFGFDPPEATNGDIWYREDLNQIRVKLNNQILILNTTAPI
jgi:hypothetical protein